jgi:hypothetical protein
MGPRFGRVLSLTTEIEGVATAVGAGILLGGFLAGSVLRLGGRKATPDQVAETGYVGGWLVLLALVTERLFN